MALEDAFLTASESEPMCQVDLMLLDLVHEKGITYKNLVDSCRWIAETADKALIHLTH
jgi:hypothetical protein